MRIGDEPDQDLAGACVKRGAACQQRSTDHAFGAADDRERAERSLVNVARTACERGGKRCSDCIPIEAMTAGRCGRFGVEAERVNGDLAAQIDGIAGQQSGLQCDERRGRPRANRGAHRNAGFGVHAGGNVEREDRYLRRIRPLDERRIGGGERAREAYPEESIDDE